MATFGYTGRILTVDLSSRSATDVSTQDYADRFLGGRGLAAKIYWDEVSPEANALDPVNRIVFATGPLCGVPLIAGSRWTVCGKSPAVDRFSYGNLGGTWGAELKFAGYDAVAVHGRSDKPVYLFVHDGTAELRDAGDLWGKGAIDTREALQAELGQSAKVVAIGPGGENMAVMANVIADNDASGSKGLGAVMGSKRLKAIAAIGGGRRAQVAQPERLRQLLDQYRGLKRGFPYYDEAFYDVLCRFSRDTTTEIKMIPDTSARMKKQPCYGCQGKCPRRTYRAGDGGAGKFMCHSAYFYQPWAEQYYGEWNDVPFHATKLCDQYSLDTIAIDLMISWLHQCHEAGILTDQNTGIPISKLGSWEFIESLIRKISLREGFGDALAAGMDHAAEQVGPAAKGLVDNAGIVGEAGYNQPYGPRLYSTTGLFWATETRWPMYLLHEVATTVSKWVTWRMMGFGYFTSDLLRATARMFWGSEAAADFLTYEGKALAAKMIQDRGYARECLVLCEWLWPIVDLEFTEDHMGDPTMESKLVSAVTGREVDKEGLDRIGEMVFNLQRAILVREGHRGRESDTLPERSYTVPLEYDVSNAHCVVPGSEGEVISRKGAVVDREEFERMKDEYYQLRQWDVATGLQTRAGLEKLGLQDVAQDLEQRGLLAAC